MRLPDPPPLPRPTAASGRTGVNGRRDEGSIGRIHPNKKKPIEWARPSRASMWLAFTGERWRLASARAKNEFAPFVQLLIRQTGLGSAGEGRVPHTAAFGVEINASSLTFLQTRSGSVHPLVEVHPHRSLPVLGPTRRSGCHIPSDDSQTPFSGLSRSHC